MEIIPRRGRLERKTKETHIKTEICLDGHGTADLETGVPFLDHMLELFCVHGLFDLHVQARGDLEIDAHHTVEDIGICLGGALRAALDDRRGLRRYGHGVVPMDEALAQVTVDLSNRPFLVCRLPPMAPQVGQFETELVPEFLRAFCVNAGLTLHVQVPYGENSHHILEAVFKALGQALDQATRVDERRTDVPSSKGML